MKTSKPTLWLWKGKQKKQQKTPGNWDFLDKLIWVILGFPFTKIRNIATSFPEMESEMKEEENKEGERGKKKRKGETKEE